MMTDQTNDGGRDPFEGMPAPEPDLDAPVVPPEPPERQEVAGTADRDAETIATDAETPEAVQEATTATRREGRSAGPRPRTRGVEWVRPSELVARHTAFLAGRGIDLHTELHRRTRVATTTGVRKIGSTMRRLPPLSAFGRSHPAPAGPTRASAGMS